MMFTYPRKLFSKLLSVALATLLLACTDNEAQFQQAVTAYETGNYSEALRLWKPLAEQGDADAQRNLGMMYYTGQGVAQNHQQAVAWWQKAANQGDIEAQYNLGNIYIIAQDHQKAIAWWQKVLAQPDTPENAEIKASVRRGFQAFKDAGIY